jgi:hypothetical protein
MTRERLKELLSYDPNTGVFRWRVDRKCGNHHKRICVKAGDQAGYYSAKDGYLRVHIDGRRILGQRLAWLYVHGCFPKEDIDHTNGIPSDNRLSNLRESNRSQNLANGKCRRSGLKGACFDKSKGKWIAQITKNSKNHYLGRFATEQEAHNAYMAAAIKLFGEFARPQ